MPVAQQEVSLTQEIDDFVHRYHRGQRLWSFAHHTSTFGAGIISLVVAFIATQTLPASWPSKDLIMGILSLIAGVLTFLATKGGFERKWRTNRKTRAALESLLTEARAPNAQDGKIRSKLREILNEHEKGIMGAEQ